ncbi:MAG: glycosyltransferase family 39 protein [Nitrospirae bacterium]|nr:glycosyltransferase family 39 protein [Candidatus Manganitrophaceae bacterium]
MLSRVNLLTWFLVSIVLSRLLTMALVPMMDTTEARYAEIARIMAETGDWITPWFDYGTPFWGKPPLSFWLQALSFRLFGVSEFAARLPSWLANLGMLALIYHLTLKISGRIQALIAAGIFSTIAMSYVLSGAVLTDPFLALGTTLSLVSFILALKQPHSLWCWGFFAGLAIGLLAKGPLALILTFGPLFLWILWRRSFQGLSHIPWVRGLLLSALFSLPWYIAAEYKTPGFIDYFIVGEHFMRFIDPGWRGDLYGSAHQRTYGTIWLYWLEATFPWGIVAIILFIRRWGSIGYRKSISEWQASHEQRLLLLATFFPSLFFTFSGNILSTYQLPALAPFSVLLATQITSAYSDTALKKTWPIFIAACIPLLGMLVGVAASFYPEKLKTEKNLVAYYNTHKDENSQPLVYLGKPPFSARYYSKGQVTSMALPEVESLMGDRTPVSPMSRYFIAIRNGNMDKTSPLLSQHIKSVFSNKRYTLFQITHRGKRTSQNEIEQNIAQ